MSQKRLLAKVETRLPQENIRFAQLIALMLDVIVQRLDRPPNDVALIAEKISGFSASAKTCCWQWRVGVVNRP